MTRDDWPRWNLGDDHPATRARNYWALWQWRFEEASKDFRYFMYLTVATASNSVTAYLAGYEANIPIIVAVTVIGGIAFAGFYEKSGLIWAKSFQEQRRKNNYVDPKLGIQNMMYAHMIDDIYGDELEFSMVERVENWLGEYSRGIDTDRWD